MVDWIWPYFKSIYILIVTSIAILEEQLLEISGISLLPTVAPDKVPSRTQHFWESGYKG